MAADLKFSISMTAFLLIGLGMLMTNGVILLFWHASLLSQSVDSMNHNLMLLAHLDRQDDISRNFKESLLSTMQQSEARCAILVTEQVETFGNDVLCSAGLQQVAAEVQSGDRTVKRYTHNPVFALFNQESYLHVAAPLQGDGRGAGAIGFGIPLSVFWQDLWEDQKIIAVYILVNAIILTVVAFFRMSKMILRPIDSLVDSVTAYSGNQVEAFMVDKASSEFGQLSLALSSMLNTINADRSTLQANIRELEKVNHELRQTRSEMIHAEKLAAVGKLSAGLAHEIGNPLGVVVGYLGLLEQQDIEETDRQEYLKRAGSELERIHALIRQLLDYSRASSVKDSVEVVHVNAVITDVVSLVQCRAHSDMRFEFDLSSSPDTVLASEESLRQVFMNCLLNAVEAIGEREQQGSGLITIASTSVHAENSVEIIVTIDDNGAGIAAEDLSLVFDPFFTTKPAGRGTGLGLSVSSAIVAELGGAITMENRPDQGVRASIRLPLAQAGEEYRPPGASASDG